MENNLTPADLDRVHTAAAVAFLELQQIDNETVVDYPQTLRGLREIEVESTHIAKSIGLAAIQEGLITQREVAEVLGVHPQTVLRWIKAQNLDQASE